MPVVAVLNQKGGVGKTTLATNLAAGFASAGERVQYIDADPQATALDTSGTKTSGPVFPVVGIPRNTLHDRGALAGRKSSRIKCPAFGFEGVAVDGSTNRTKLDFQA
jgi:cellulose biosynthesis protein BcsQ